MCVMNTQVLGPPRLRGRGQLARAETRCSGQRTAAKVEESGKEEQVILGFTYRF